MKRSRGDEEMTVVVPPSKSEKRQPQPDGEGDISMDDAVARPDSEPAVDPLTKTVAGMLEVCTHNTTSLVGDIAARHHN